MSFTRPQYITMSFAQDGDKTPIGDTPSLVQPSQPLGFPVLYSTPLDDGGKPIDRKQFNGIMNLYSQFILWNNVGGTYGWNAGIATTGYPLGAVIWYNNQPILSNIANNKVEPTDSTVSTSTTATDWYYILPQNATELNVQQGTDNNRLYVNSHQFINTRATQTQVGTTQLSTQTQVNKGTDNTTAVTPSALINASWISKLNDVTDKDSVEYPVGSVILLYGVGDPGRNSQITVWHGAYSSPSASGYTNYNMGTVPLNGTWLASGAGFNKYGSPNDQFTILARRVA